MGLWFDHSESLQRVITPDGLEATCSNLIGEIERSKVDFNTIAFTGFSGAMVVPMLCVMLNKYPFVVRKADEHAHSYLKVEGPTGADINYIIVDDLMSTGTTVHYVLETIAAKRSEAKCVGLFLYNQKDYGLKNFSFPTFYWTGNTWRHKAGCPVTVIP